MGSAHQLAAPDWAVVALYLAGILAFGLWSGRRILLDAVLAQKDILPPIPPTHHVIRGAGILDAQFACHGPGI